MNALPDPAYWENSTEDIDENFQDDDKTDEENPVAESG
jgi:hypothetical protein